MRITLAAVGRAKKGPLRELFGDYSSRLRHGPLGPMTLKEVEERRPLPVAKLRAREAELLHAAIPSDARLVALDERGKAMSSAEFATLLGRWRDEGVAEAAFVVGGAEGLDPALTGAADRVLSLGPMTWPHLLVRALLAEQLYRAQCILSGHPYHRD